MDKILSNAKEFILFVKRGKITFYLQSKSFVHDKNHFVQDDFDLIPDKNDFVQPKGQGMGLNSIGLICLLLNC